MTITLDGSSLTIEKLVAIARWQARCDSPEWRRTHPSVGRCGDQACEQEIMYGTNTGIESSQKVLQREQVKEFQFLDLQPRPG
jgi:histidine ammonia-lyase